MSIDNYTNSIGLHSLPSPIFDVDDPVHQMNRCISISLNNTSDWEHLRIENLSILFLNGKGVVKSLRMRKMVPHPLRLLRMVDDSRH